MSAATRIACLDIDSSEPVSPETLLAKSVFSDEVSIAAFHSFFDKAPIGVARCDGEGVILQINVHFERLVADLTNSRPARLTDLVVFEDREKVESLLHQVSDYKADGMRLSVHLSGCGREALNWTAWREAGVCGEPVAIWVFAETASGSESEANGEDFLQAQRWEAIGRLTGGVVHDFNNLLTGVMLYCDLLLSAFDERDLRRRYAEEIRSAIIPATGLVRQLLVFARPQPADCYPVSFNEIAEGMRDLLIRLVGENISLELSLDPRLASVEISRSQAQQVLLNLVLNARDAMPKGGRICIRTNNTRFQPIDSQAATVGIPGFPCVLISVIDDGKGMDAETRGHLFEPFFTTKTGKGSGLGLTTVQSIVASHHGLIRFESQPERGTCAMILLPRAVDRAEGKVSVDQAMAPGASNIKFQDLKKDSLS